MTAGHKDSSPTNIECNGEIYELLAVLIGASHEERDSHGYSLPFTPLRVDSPPPSYTNPFPQATTKSLRSTLPCKEDAEPSMSA